MSAHTTVCFIVACLALTIPRAGNAAAEAGNLLEAIQQGKPLSSLRLRYENVDQHAFETADAWTLRSLIGWQSAPFKHFSFGVQISDVHEFNDNFNDRRDNLSVPNKSQLASIVDPSFTDINQLYVDWTGIKNTKLRLGRQIVNLDNVRFIGDIAFRQNTQVFDGISVTNKSLPNTEIFASHFTKIRQVNTKLRDGNISMLNAKYRFTPTESLTGYGYLVDVANLSQNNGNAAAVNTAAQGGNGLGASDDLVKTATTDASSKTFGVRLDGVHIFNPTFLNQSLKGLYTAEYAKQDDYRGGNDLIDAHYFKIGGGLGYDVWSLRIDHEKLSSNHSSKNKGKYAFQTPLGTNHLFQGWADHFLATPRQGIEDTFVTFAGSIEKAKLFAEYHVFKADKDFQSTGKLGDKYGTEFDASVLYPFADALSGKIEYAKFSESDVYGALNGAARKADKEIVWITGLLTF
jgi:hypothetical protein